MNVVVIDKSKPSERLEKASAYFKRLGAELHTMAKQVEELERKASMVDKQAEHEYQQEILKAEEDRDEWRERAEDLEEAVDCMRLELLTPEEVIERARERQPQ